MTSTPIASLSDLARLRGAPELSPDASDRLRSELREAMAKASWFTVLAVIGAKEAEQNAVSLRSRRDGDIGVTPVADLLNAAQTANSQRAAGLELN